MDDVSLREPLSAQHLALFRVMYDQFAVSSEWPIWQYVELILDAKSLDAAELLNTLPTIRGGYGRNYSLVWYMNPGPAPSADQQVALTVAGMRYIPESVELINTLLLTVEFLVDQQRRVVPAPTKVVEATVTSDQMREHLLKASLEGLCAPPVDLTITKLHELFVHEPILFSGVQRPNPDAPAWSIRVPWALRELRGTTTVDEYLDRTINFVAPAVTSPPPIPIHEPDLPTALGYVDAVWRSRTGRALFASFDPTSIARLTAGCGSESDFNSLLSSLADVLGQVVPPGVTKPSQRGALETLQKAIVPMFEVDAAQRVSEAIDQLLVIRRLRVSTQHADARHRAVSAFQGLGMTFPPPSWETAWAQVAALAEGALTTLREETLAGIKRTFPGTGT